MHINRRLQPQIIDISKW